MMSVLMAYLGVVLIWATTPLAIQWSSGGISFMAAVSLRMLVALVIGLSLLGLLRRNLFCEANDWQRYGVAALGIFPNMPLVYWSAQFIPSGLIALIMGLSPFITGVMSMLLLRENPFNGRRIAALAIALAGLAVIYTDQLSLGDKAVYGVSGMLLSCFFFSFCSVWLKRLGGNIDPLRQTTGTLLMSVPALLVSWWLLEGSWPQHWSSRTVLSIGYLSLFGSMLGFSLYFYILRHLSVNTVSLTYLITPVLAICVGVFVAGEQVSAQLLGGAAMVVLSLGLYQGLSPQVIARIARIARIGSRGPRRRPAADVD
ncbi:DMT family transporter [Exilibacterium tricleocarpae]|uniref:DMT family transporter n=1 Tax=Exilibacterium tricleocarpae TaxID=2591008 RepID=A0A545T3K2_9GAMM|nr:DMT family transporter [Exilibacterium tricleocarpae]TQV71797.1 DMT family transporter [Exilibacterium tricleocarpae]